MSDNYVDKTTVDGVDYDLRDSGSVRYDESQSLTNAQKETARSNVGAASTGEVDELKSAFDATENDLFKLIGNIPSPWEKGGMYSATGIEYSDNSKIRTPFIKVNPGDTIYIENSDATLTLNILEFASNTATVSGTNERLAITYANSSVKSVTLGNSTNYIRLQLSIGDTLKGDGILLYTKNSVIFNKSVTVNGALPNNTDANDLTIVGFFLINSTYTYENLPISTGFLVNYSVLTNVSLQIAYSWNNKNVYKRNRVNNEWSDWVEIGSGVINNYTNEYSFPEYNNEYTIENVFPQITTDTNAYLAPSGDASDRTAEIISMLTNQGICRLGAGDYYVSNLQMPSGTTLKGVGNKTRIILSGTSAGFAIKMTSYCTVSDCLIMGKTSSITLSDILDPENTVPLRYGILWQGTYTQDQSTANQPINGMVSNVRFLYFTGGAITCYDTGYGTFNVLEVSNVFCMYCNVGVNVSYWSEYHKFTNVRTASCYYGCINNGGNNMFTNCDFSTCKVGFLMDNSSNQSPNNSHGSCVACVFNHTDSNTGIGIKILNCDAGFIFDGCQIFYSQTYIEDSDGVVFANCNYGDTNCNITISGGGVILFNGNIHQASPTKTITNNSNVHFVNCYVKSTGAVVN